MATIRKRKGKKGISWRAEVFVRGRRESGTFSTKGEAEQWAVEAQKRLGRGKEAQPTDKTLRDALERYRDQVAPTKKGQRWDQVRCDKLATYALADLFIDEIDGADLAEWRDMRLEEVSPASVNRELNLLSSVFNTAIKEWRWCTANPVRQIKRPKNPPPRQRVISTDEIELIADSLPDTDAGQQTRIAFLLALETAMRLGEIMGIQEEDVQEKYVTLRDTKNDDARDVPLSLRARELIRTFTITPALASKLFSDTVKELQLDVNFHDTRRTALTRMASKVDVLNLAKISGHRDVRMLARVYYAPKAEDLADLLG